MFGRAESLAVENRESANRKRSGIRSDFPSFDGRAMIRLSLLPPCARVDTAETDGWHWRSESGKWEVGSGKWEVGSRGGSMSGHCYAADVDADIDIDLNIACQLSDVACRMSDVSCQI
jgi:hypothetical protein